MCLSGTAADADPPHLRALLKVVPFELVGVLGGELVVQRFWVVVVDEHEAIAGRQVGVGLEDQVVSAGRDLLADVEDLVGVVYGGCSFCSVRRT